MKKKPILILLGIGTIMGTYWMQPIQKQMFESNNSPHGPTKEVFVSMASKVLSGAQAKVVRPDVPAHRYAQLHQSLQLVRKALRSESDQQTLHEQLQDHRLIETAFRVLSSEQETRWNTEKAFERMHIIDWVGTGLAWKENPQRELIENKAVELISKNQQERQLGRVLRKSLVGDQMELFMILARTRPTRARELYENLRDTPQGKVVAYALNFDLENNLKGGR